MELRKGYKKTDAGVIPEDWEMKSIEELTPRGKKYCIVDGPFGSNLKTIHYKKSGIPIITSGYVTNGKFFAEDYLYVDIEKFKQEKRSAVCGGDIVMAKIGERCGASAILPLSHEQGILSGNALKITIDEEKYVISLIWQILWNYHQKGDFKILKTTGAQPALSMANLKRFKIPLPPTKAEQTAIADALSDADALIGGFEKLIAKKRNIKQGTMQVLLTGKKRLPGFRGKWEKCHLRRFVQNFIVPMRDKPKQFKGDIPWCRIEDFEGMYLNGSKSGQCVDIHTIRTMNLKVYQVGTLLVSCSADLGRCSIVARPLISNQTFIGLEMDKTVSSNLFFYYYMTSKAEELNNLSSGTTISYLSREKFEVFDVFVPIDKQEQTAIATILSDMDAEIVSLEQKLNKYKMVKQGMMQELLTGKTRLI